MDTNSRNSDQRNGISNPDTKPHHQDLKLNAEQYSQLSYLQLRWQIQRKEALLCSRDAEIIALKKTILALQHQAKMNSISTANSRELTAKADLEKYRTEVAQQLGLNSLDPYIIDTDTLVLTHEDNIDSKIKG